VKAIVVGSGFAGLAAADELRRGDADVTVLEARDRVGGRVWSVPFAGGVAERGAEFVMPEYDSMLAAVDRLGLSLVRKGTMYGCREPRGGDRVSMPELAAAMQRVAAMPESARRGATTVRGALAALGLEPGVSEAICARLEVSCTYAAGDLEVSALLEGAGSFGEFDTHTVEGGNDRLARELAAQLGDAVRCSTPVTGIDWSGNEVRAHTNRGTFTGDAVVVSVPATVIEQIAFDPPLPAAKLAALRAARYGQAAKLFVGLRSPAPPSATLSVPERYWCYTQLGVDGAPLRFVAAFAGTPGALEKLEVVRGPQRWIASLLALRPDLELDPETALLARWDDDPWVRGSYTARSASSPMDTAALEAPVGPLHFAGEHTSGAWHGLMEGALRSGERAANEVLRRSAPI
jgi:monoamine oxidase